MKKLIFILIAALGVSMAANAQMSDKEMKKAITEAKKIVKEARKNIEGEDADMKCAEAKRLIDGAMQNDLINEWDQTWVAAADIYCYLFKKEYTKTTFIGQKYDTLGMYTNLCKWIDYAIIADSLQQIPDSKGKTKDQVRKEIVPKIIAYSGNLVIGGVTYLTAMNDYEKTYWLCDKYFSLAETDLFKDAMNDDQEWNEKRVRYSFYPAYAAFNMQDWNKCLKYAPIAMDDDEYGETATEFVCYSYEGLGDTVKWVEALKAGLMKYPTENLYYSNLIKYYSGDLGALESFIKDMIAIDPEKPYNYFVMGFIAQNNNEYEKAIEQFKNAIEKDKDNKMGDAYYNICLCYRSMAEDIEAANTKVDPRSAAGKKVKAQVEDLIKQTLPYYEKYREIAPNDITKWGFGLYDAYYRLGMNNEFKAIEKVLNENHMLD